MTFIHVISQKDAEGRLQTLYNRVKGPDGRIDNILSAHSLRPASLEGHLALYKNVLHHSGNTTPKGFLETIGVLVSMINECRYCIDHHFAGLRRLLKDDQRAGAIKTALSRFAGGKEIGANDFSPKEILALQYADLVTRAPDKVTAQTITDLRDAGWTDGGILELNQVSAYFAYANRTVLGLGVTIEGDALGLSPNNSSDENDWSHR